MKIITYPTLLNKRARIFADFNRSDLVVLGISFLVSSQFNMGGILSLILMMTTLFLFKSLTARLPRKFFKLLMTSKSLPWFKGIGGNYER